MNVSNSAKKAKEYRWLFFIFHSQIGEYYYDDQAGKYSGHSTIAPGLSELGEYDSSGADAYLYDGAVKGGKIFNLFNISI